MKKITRKKTGKKKQTSTKSHEKNKKVVAIKRKKVTLKSKK